MNDHMSQVFKGFDKDFGMDMKMPSMDFGGFGGINDRMLEAFNDFDTGNFYSNLIF